MKKNLTELVFILDRSGSMAGLEADTIGGFNSMIERQKKEEGEAYVSTALFSNESTVLHDRLDIREVEPMTGKQYFVGGSTALLSSFRLGSDRSHDADSGSHRIAASLPTANQGSLSVKVIENRYIILKTTAFVKDFLKKRQRGRTGGVSIQINIAI